MINYEELIVSYRNKPDSEVVEVVKFQDEYTPDAVKAAIEVLQERGVETPAHVTEETRIADEVASRKPLSVPDLLTLIALSLFIPFVELFWLLPWADPAAKRYARTIFKIRTVFVGVMLIFVLYVILVDR